MAATPLRAIRIPDDEWVPAQQRAAELGETVTDVVRRALVDYVKGCPRCGGAGEHAVTVNGLTFYSCEADPKPQDSGTGA